MEKGFPMRDSFKSNTIVLGDVNKTLSSFDGIATYMDFCGTFKLFEVHRGYLSHSTSN